MRYIEGCKEQPSYWGEFPTPKRKQANVWHGNICAPGTNKAQNIWRNITQDGMQLLRGKEPQTDGSCRVYEITEWVRLKGSQ